MSCRLTKCESFVFCSFILKLCRGICFSCVNFFTFLHMARVMAAFCHPDFTTHLLLPSVRDWRNFLVLAKKNSQNGRLARTFGRCGIFRYTQLKSGTHPGPISWALGGWGPNCKMKFYLMSTLHSTSTQLFGHKSLHASDCTHCHTTPSKERNFWPFLYSSAEMMGYFEI